MEPEGLSLDPPASRATSMTHAADTVGASGGRDPTAAPKSFGTRSRAPNRPDVTSPGNRLDSFEALTKAETSKYQTAVLAAVEKTPQMVRPLHRPCASANEA